VAIAAVAALAAGALVPVGAAGASGRPPAPPPAGAWFRVGAASRSVLPRVDGGHAYTREGFPSRHDPYDPGIPVARFDDGRIAVGNGNRDARWVHDDVRVAAMAVSSAASREVLVLVSTDLYMIFRQDADVIRWKVLVRLPPALWSRVRVLVTATHNHHGPDTAFDINHSWYAWMTDRAADAVVAAIGRMRPARLRVASGEHFFGARDGTDPQVFDPTLGVLQAVGADGRVIATAVHWNNHPEATLFWSPPREAIAADCARIGLAGDDCHAKDRYLSADFPGVLRQDLQRRYGGQVLFLNGALGVIIGPGSAQVWEVSAAHPLGNGITAPPGAPGPGGVADVRAENFRRTVLIGEQLAAAVVRLLERGRPEWLRDPRLGYRSAPMFVRLTNFGFRVLLVVDPATGRTSLGHTVGVLYECPPGPGPFTAADCRWDGNRSVRDDLVGVDHRRGDHVASAVEYVRIGPVGMMFLPGEVPSEVTRGLPAGFRSSPERWYAEPRELHAFGDAFTTGGYVLRHMRDRYRWTIGLGSDELGYFVPLSNFRVRCVADEFAGEGTCALLHAIGAIDFPDSLAGTTCKRVTEDPASITWGEPIRTAIVASCRYGQALGEARGHYEETNSASWDLVPALLEAVRQVTGVRDATEVNPDFPGWWEGYPPPGGSG
jgi:hypothetical protein